MTRKVANSLMLLSAVTLILVACGGAVEPEPDEILPIRITENPYLTNAPLIIADAEGYYAEQGLEVEFVPFDRTADALPALAQGDIDVWAGATDAGVWNIIASGANIRVVANKGYYAPGDCYATMLGPLSLQDEGGLDNPEAIHGGKVSYSPGGIGEYWFEKVFAENGLDIDQVELVSIPPPSLPEAIGSGEVVLGAGVEPISTLALRSGDVYVVRDISQDLEDFEFAHIMFGPSILEDNPELGQRFMVAYLKAVRQYSEGKTARNLNILSEALSIDRGLLEEACWPNFRADLSVQFENLEVLQEWGVEKGYQDEVLGPDQMIDTQFIEYALQTIDE